MRRSFASVVAALAILGSGCSSGGGGDLDHVSPHPNTLGTPIAKQNDPATRLPSNATFVAKGVVVIAVDTYDETKDGKSIGNIYVQDPVQPTPWSGMTLYQVTRIPTDLQVVPGMGVDVIGPYQPFAGPSSGVFSNGIVLPEIVKGTITQTYEAPSPDPVDITMADIADPVKSMQYVGRLVRMSNVQITGSFDAKRHEAAINSSTAITLASQLVALDDPMGINLTMGTTLKSVTGVMNYFYTLKLCPRNADDIVK
jgi:hypothetical protein